MGKRVFIIAGEASGDVHGANLVKAMAAADPSLSFRGVGGRELREAGVQLLRDAAEVAVVGLLEVARHLLTIASAFRLAIKTLRTWQPHLLILIDYPDFNLLVARKAKQLGIPVMYYISPQVWAWRSGRVRTIRRCVDRMVVLFPFEEILYREAEVPVSFVGHPFLDAVTGRDREELGRRLALGSGGRPLVGLLPGSRQNEVRALLPIMLEAAASLARRMPHARFLLPLASTIRAEDVRPSLQGRDLPLTVIEGRTHEAIQACELIVAASGSVTLEAAILGTPLVIVYKVHRLSYEIGRRLIRVKHIGLVNLVAGETVAPELIQDQVTAEGIVKEVMDILEDPGRQAWIRSRLEEVRRRLGSPGASVRAAEIALSLLGTEIVYEINRRFLSDVAARFPNDPERISRLSLIEEGGEKKVRMAHLACVGSHAVNGVAALHSELLKKTLLKDFHEFEPGMFHNVTNGVTPRRWMVLSNPGLSALISEKIGERWIAESAGELRTLEPFAQDPSFRDAWRAVKQANKTRLAAFVKSARGSQSTRKASSTCRSSASTSTSAST